LAVLGWGEREPALPEERGWGSGDDQQPDVNVDHRDVAQDRDEGDHLGADVDGRGDAPAAHASTIRARCASACAVFGRRAHCANVSRSVVVTTSVAFGRPSAIRHLLIIAETAGRQILFRELRAQDTREATTPCLGLRGSTAA